jgi:hypothetical protein
LEDHANHATIQAHIAVNIHCKGVAPLATAKEIDNGIDIKLTVNQAFIFGNIDFIKLEIENHLLKKFITEDQKIKYGKRL